MVEGHRQGLLDVGALAAQPEDLMVPLEVAVAQLEDLVALLEAAEVSE